MQGRGFFYSMLFRVQYSCFFAGAFLCLVVVNIRLHPSDPMWVLNLVLMVVFLRWAQVSTKKLRRHVPEISEVKYND